VSSSKGEAFLSAVIDAIGEEYVRFVNQYGDWLRFIPGPMHIFITPNVVENAIANIKQAIHDMPSEVKSRIAINIERKMKSISDQYVDNFLVGRKDRELEAVLQKMDWLR
jgi:hypothetical protein